MSGIETGVVLVGAGSGARFGRAKALVELGGRTLVARSAEAFEAFPHRVAVLRAEDLEAVDLPGWTLVAGGERRRDSVARGLAALPAVVTRVLIHDAARPLVSRELVARMAAHPGPAAIPVVPVTDTVKEVVDGRVVQTLDRSRLAAVQTPQLFEIVLLKRALAASGRDATDEAGLVEEIGEAVAAVPGDPQNLKITTPADLLAALALLSG